MYFFGYKHLPHPMAVVKGTRYPNPRRKCLKSADFGHLYKLGASYITHFSCQVLLLS
jgi:hypothetical protein